MRSPIVALLATLVAVAHSDSDVDWLVSRPAARSAVKSACWDYGDVQPVCGLEIGNGLLSRRFVLQPAFGTLDYVLNATTERGGEQSMLRVIRPEGRITLDGVEYNIGGLVQKQTPPTIFHAYLNRSSLELEANRSAFQFKSYRVDIPQAPFKWTAGTRGSPKEYSWPPKGATLAVTFALPPTIEQWSTIASFNNTATNTSQRQEFVLPNSPVTARYWKFACDKSCSPEPPAIAELEFRVNGQWLKNNGTAMRSFVVSASSQGPFPARGGAGWQAVDGIPRTVWAAVKAPHWLLLDLGQPMAVEAIGLTTAGDNVHDPRWFDMQAMVDMPVPAKHQELELTVWYEIFDDIPLLSKWVTVGVKSGGVDRFGRVAKWGNRVQGHVHKGGDDVIVDTIVVEIFGAMPRFGAYIPHGSFVPGADWGGAASGNGPNPLLHAKTDQAHNAHCVWRDDFFNSRDPVPDCEDCLDEGAVEPVLECEYALGPGAHVGAGEAFVSFRVLELANDDTDLTRTSLARHRLTTVLAPHVSENPVFFHATNVTEAGFKAAVDQMVDVGFEMLIYSFGSGFDLETSNRAYLDRIKAQVEYANSRGIEVGGYDLICLQRGHGGYGGNVGDKWVTVEPQSNALLEDACFSSGWYDKLHQLVSGFVNYTGLSMLETDGPYGGGHCASGQHDYHHGLEDSIYRQTQMQSQFFWELRELGVYVNQPDDYFFAGGSRTGMGYDEQQYSLPRWRDLSISRMGLYDDLYAHLPTQGWMFLPLTTYHAGGEDATFLEFLKAYEWALAQYLGAGTAACYRGPVLYTNNATRDVLAKWVKFYKTHRGSLIQPVQHLRRPDMQGWDGWLHVNPFSLSTTPGEIGVAVLFNPTLNPLKLTLSLPLYYCGVTDLSVVRVSVNDENFVSYPVLRDYNIRLPISMPPQSLHTIVIMK